MIVLKKYILPVVIALSFMSGIWKLATDSGSRLAQQHIERLELLWPDFMKMGDMDRGRLAMASRECHLESVPMEKGAVVRCLSDGAEKLRERDLMASVRVHELLKDQHDAKK